MTAQLGNKRSAKPPSSPESVCMMLGEGFLQVLEYSRESSDPHPPTHEDTHRTPPKLTAESCANTLNPRSPLTPRAMTVGKQAGREKPGPRLSSAPSSALAIPSCSADEYWGLELYRSWCCPSLCKAYPDLQLRGDQLGDRSSQSPRWESLAVDGPLLQSQDLGELEALPEPGARVEALAQPEQGYLAMESSMVGPGWERLSNSMLNGYLESKLLEVYRQHMQDSLARGGAEELGTVAMVPSSLAVPAGEWLAQREGLDSGAAHSSLVVHYLSTCSAPPTSHFSSPVLRISHAEEPKQPP